MTPKAVVEAQHLRPRLLRHLRPHLNLRQKQMRNHSLRSCLRRFSLQRPKKKMP